jgi:hypothetical protein
VDLDSVHERVTVDGSGVCGALAQRLEVRFAGSADVILGDLSERDKLYAIDLDLTRADSVAAARLDPWTLPQADRKRDVSGQDVVA